MYRRKVRPHPSLRMALAAPLSATVGLLSLAPRASLAWEASFAQARAAAERLAPEVQLAARRADVADSEVGVAGTLANPTLSVSTARETARLGSSLAVPVPLFGQRRAAIDAARADAKVAGLDLQATRTDSRWRATLAWIDLWEAQERARLLGQAATDAARLFDVASKRFEAGAGPRVDVVRTQADSARARSDLQDAVHLVRAAAARLSPWLGASWTDDGVAVGLPGYSARLAISLPGLVERLSGHPLLRRDRAQIGASSLHLASEERLRWPIVTPQLTVNQFDPTVPGTDVIFGLSFELPMLNLRGGAIARARAQQALGEAAFYADTRQLHAELLDAYQRTRGAAERLEALRRDVLPGMKEARDMTLEGYQSGRVDLLRLLDAQRALLDSELAEVQALASFSRAAADLENATGIDLGAEQ